MNNFWITVSHTAGRRIKSKAFVISTIFMVVLILGLTNITNIIDLFSSDESEDITSVAVVDETLTDNFFGETLASYDDGLFNYVNFTGELDDAIEDAGNNGHDFVLYLTGDISTIEAEFYSDGNDFMMSNEVNQDVQRMKEALATNELGLNEEELSIIYSPITFNEQPLREGGEVQTMETHMQAYWMVYFLVFAIYMIVLTFGSMIATEVATEKSSRVMELIVSSINPVTQMLGKIVGIGVAGLLNLLAIAAAAIIGSYLSGEEFIKMIFTEVIDVWLIVLALVLILLGYFLYGGIAAMLGALVSRAEEVNQALQPLVFLAMIGLFVSIFGLNTPDATFIQVLSYVPFFTPQLLFLRIGMSAVPMWEVTLILGILVLSAIIFNIIAARIYKGGVLMYGKFSFKDGLKQAFTIGKKEK
ncbi:ABC transporter permease [Evansella sp. AB-P1]|uniref:ABC transporter permease n=1 Tax=Evansella sp. AB-P1 TaxID=3037653 RepID=UPI00241D4F24|nr:ABC transporter permease [Evansella sp. AB-P1]MDG5788338.1 ABC transporter permease [Evansella sp. AB-P1]